MKGIKNKLSKMYNKNSYIKKLKFYKKILTTNFNYLIYIFTNFINTIIQKKLHKGKKNLIQLKVSSKKYSKLLL